MKKLLKKIASRILRQEIEAMNKDFYRAGIRAVGDRDFQMITEILSA